MPSLQDILLTREIALKNSQASNTQMANQAVVGAFENLAAGVTKRIEDERALKQRDQLIEKYFSTDGVNLNTNASKIEAEMDLETGKIKRTIKTPSYQDRKIIREEKEKNDLNVEIDNYFSSPVTTPESRIKLIKLGMKPQDIDDLERQKQSVFNAIQVENTQPPVQSPLSFNKVIDSRGKSSVISREPLGVVAEKFDDLGRPKDLTNLDAMEPLKKAEVAAQKSADIEASLPMTRTMMYQFDRSLDEVSKKIPEAFEQGLEGWVARQGLKIGSSKFIDEFPSVATLADNIKAAATAKAKINGEKGVLTDPDIERALTTLLDPRERSLETNLEKIMFEKKRLEEDDKNTEWMDPFIERMQDKIKQMKAKRSNTFSFNESEYEITEE